MVCFRYVVVNTLHKGDDDDDDDDDNTNNKEPTYINKHQHKDKHTETGRQLNGHARKDNVPCVSSSAIPAPTAHDPNDISEQRDSNVPTSLPPFSPNLCLPGR